MIRRYRESDIEPVLEIWLTASIQAHAFVNPGFWSSKVDEMRHTYIPASETFVFESYGKVIGFYCLLKDTLAAIFVSPDRQGKGVGSALIDDAKKRRRSLRLTVYQANRSSVAFYKNHGFVIVAEQIDDSTGQLELVMEYQS
jgi:putative acetyltransferase